MRGQQVQFTYLLWDPSLWDVPEVLVLALGGSDRQARMYKGHKASHSPLE